MPNLHSFAIRELNSENMIHFSDFKGKKVLLVNVASKCGFTPQYEQLQMLYEQFAEKLVVVGFPCNQFLWQEPANEANIEQFCSQKYGVTFPMTEKIYVKGNKQHPIYAFLSKKEQNLMGDFKVNWNFNKFLIDEKGILISYFNSKVNPLDEQVVSKI